MTRTCDFPAPTTGAPCTQLVGDLEDHCAAGHACPPVGRSGPAAVHQASSAAGVGEIDELLETLEQPSAPRPRFTQLTDSTLEVDDRLYSRTVWSTPTGQTVHDLVEDDGRSYRIVFHPTTGVAAATHLGADGAVLPVAGEEATELMQAAQVLAPDATSV